MTSVSPVLRRLLALTILLAVAFAVWALIANPLMALQVQNARAIEGTKQLIAGFSRAAADRPRLQESLKAIEGRQTGQGKLLASKNADLAAAELQQRLKQVIGASGGTAESISILQPEDRASFRKITLRVAVASNTVALQKILHALENSAPYLYIQNLDVRLRNQSQSAARRAGGHELQSRLDVHGYMAKAAP